ncbi:hypothetical protein L1047_10650 [Synechococcus sp. Nb3U1]|uniref:hypothetical protein n=1 Tax=Synechococcus sp. Nb3U1 TaxID=1914529 RepID=UPI001F2C48FD|nr:hypothetical protein [Synechococcus sp. Nb3U1]MCF2971652.1 hypothetical protein [Synechococcus sp. Nb3U1]
MIVIDGVIWQSEGFFRSYTVDQSQIWLSLIAEWLTSKKSTELVILTRGQTWLPPGTFFTEIPRFSFEEVEEDRVGLQSICDQLKAKLFISTGYTTPLSTPSVAFVYDLEVERGSQFQSEYLEKKNSLLNAVHYVCFSDVIKVGLQEYYPGIPSDHISVVYPAIGSWARPASANLTAEFRRKYKLTRPFFLAVIPEQIVDYRGIQALSQAWELMQGQKLSRTELVFAFPSSVNVDPAKAQMPQANGLHYLSLTNAELACAYSASLALIAHDTFRAESALEAMACGCPVVSYRDDRSGTKQSHLRSSETLASTLLCQGSLQELAEALVQIQTYQVRTPLISKGLERAKGFSWPVMAEQLWEIFEQVTAEQHLAV